MHTANQVADFFLSKIDIEKGDTISPLKLQKLVYYAQAWNYTIFGEPLFDERIEAWVNGPVIPTVYARFAGTTKYTSINLSTSSVTTPTFDEKTTKLLTEVLGLYGERSAQYLENLTHSESPWIIARGDTPPYAISKNEITLESMKDYYSKFLNGAKE